MRTKTAMRGCRPRLSLLRRLSGRLAGLIGCAVALAVICGPALSAEQWLAALDTTELEQQSHEEREAALYPKASKASTIRHPDLMPSQKREILAMPRSISARKITQRDRETCGLKAPMDWGGKVEIRETQAYVAGKYAGDSHNCLRGSRIQSSGRFVLARHENTRRRSLLTYSRSAESGAGALRMGSFVGGFMAETPVTTAGQGLVGSFGAKAGIYGARVSDVLTSRFYLAGLFGQHHYDLTFSTSDGDIQVSGHRPIATALGGFALQGKIGQGRFSFRPKGSIDLQSGHAETARLTAKRINPNASGIYQFDTQRLVKTALELGLKHEVASVVPMGWERDLWMAPRVNCNRSLIMPTECKIGMSLSYELEQDSRGAKYGLKADAETDGDTRQRKLKLTRKRSFHDGAGYVRGAVRFDETDKPHYSYELSFAF